MERVVTGVPGLDPLIEGGIPKGFNVVVIGHPGAGKTILSLQYLYNGALKGENGLYITVDADGDMIRDQGQKLGWDIRKLESEKKIYILEVPLNTRLRINLFGLIESKVKQYGIKRIVFDSLSSFMFNINQFNIQLPNINDLSELSREESSYLEEEVGIRSGSIPEAVQKLRPDPIHYETVSRQRIVYLVFRELSRLNTTNMLVASASAKKIDSTVDGVSEFACDGVISIHNELVGAKRVRTVTISKMRSTNQSPYIHDMELSDKGITIKSADVVYG
ncbi:MAG: AAA family ATPase [Candidatus Micrarchaeota archaeon]|nr:AAA family ATPase [Candidatus Micrarchaeota archaeon]